jgi:hypothetical protein
MNERISQSCSYDEALNVISEFVKIEWLFFFEHTVFIKEKV